MTLEVFGAVCGVGFLLVSLVVRLIHARIKQLALDIERLRAKRIEDRDVRIAAAVAHDEWHKQEDKEWREAISVVRQQDVMIAEIHKLRDEHRPHIINSFTDLVKSTADLRDRIAQLEARAPQHAGELSRDW